MSEIRIPDLRVFDRRTTRWAVLRGLVRTALTVLGFLLVGALLLQLGTRVLVNALDRPEQLERMVAAYKAAHPGLHVRGELSRTGGWHQTATLTVMAAGGPEQEVRLRLGLLGDLDVTGVGADRLVVDEHSDPVASALGGTAWTRSQTTSFLRRLPAGVRIHGVAVFPAPRTWLQLVEANFPEGMDALIYGPPFAGERGRSEPLRQFDETAVGWGGGMVAFGTFQDWARALRGDDDENLRRLGLPRSDRIKELAADGKATASYLDARTPDQIAELLATGQVASFTPTGVRFDLSPPR